MPKYRARLIQHGKVLNEQIFEAENDAQAQLAGYQSTGSDWTKCKWVEVTRIFEPDEKTANLVEQVKNEQMEDRKLSK